MTPKYFWGAKIVTFAYGSRTFLAVGSNSEGLFIILPSCSKLTEGEATIISRSYSRSSLSWVIWACKSPKNPRRNPWPKDIEDSLEYVSDESLSFNLSKPSFNLESWCGSVGQKDRKTTGFASCYPGSGADGGL